MTVPAEALRESVLAVYARVLDAWNQRDAKAFAALFTATGSAVGFDGSQMNGRGEIESELAGVFANHPTAAYVAKVREVRALGSESALVRAVVGMIPPGKTELNSSTNAVQSLLVVVESGEPKIALLHNTPAAFHGRPHLSEQLTHELAEVVRAGRTIDAG
ncbi:MAG: SgcJ/EcaC family oxidoreductase [Gemmatimonadota bacterium]|nr:SgcJ/EcaC family oxidoreductase [Gemmatimonadota bacterium]